MTEEERRDILADEWLIVRNSGEIPEIAYYSSLYYLTEDDDGPCITLSEEEIQVLKEAAVERCQEIVLRDMLLENFHKTIYRGIKRSIYNWQRYQTFCRRQSLSLHGFRPIVARTFLLFLEQGVGAAGSSLPQSFINCSLNELIRFGEELGVEAEQLPAGTDRFCREN
ncbi:MAG: hypothetical protein KKD01_07510 [Proteobacteria bacterium]|nr:hypothetical protein [Pseudomonadota bacterium]MBU1139906.1 hypothetical protein [Pseudomonadota bacterium]MBU1233443.1 hypothetical protein [Pseudomonadota bacterium]MBU1420074.1 hypothetical protein [Pseudomonadota bacterium]MBU1454563.1 hypothetical protein [Pseudomonadota bacterium]